jgi:hypothetical protein
MPTKVNSAAARDATSATTLTPVNPPDASALLRPVRLDLPPWDLMTSVQRVGATMAKHSIGHFAANEALGGKGHHADAVRQFALECGAVRLVPPGLPPPPPPPPTREDVLEKHFTEFPPADGEAPAREHISAVIRREDAAVPRRVKYLIERAMEHLYIGKDPIQTVITRREPTADEVERCIERGAHGRDGLRAITSDMSRLACRNCGGEMKNGGR